MLKNRAARHFRPFHGVEHVLDDQPQFRISLDGKITLEEQRVRVFLTGCQLQKS